MIEIEQALRLVVEQVRALPAVSLSVAEAAGLVLAEDIASDIDSPPHDKALMDGYALRAEDARAEGAELEIQERIVAGQVPRKAIVPGAASAIMTGAPIPDGADAVVMVEQTETSDRGGGSVVRIRASDVSPGQNIMRRAESIRRGDVVASRGRVVTPIGIGLLSEVGRTVVRVHRPARVAVLPTGDELVTPDVVPSAGQIRDSNGPMLKAMAARVGAAVVDLGLGRDARDDLTARVRKGLEQDVLVLSGGVSAGVMDLTPKVLAECGVRQVFHKVRLKPGKPLWFGASQAGDHRCLVFGLPGNPVGSLVCFELFVRPAIEMMMGKRTDAARTIRGRIMSAYRQRGDRPTYYPAVRELREDGIHARLLSWQGSADLRPLADADCLVVFPAGEQEFPEGRQLDVLPLDP